MNTTDDYWDIDGISLQTYAWTIEDFSGLESPPGLRGGGITVPNRPGDVWLPRRADTRTLTFGMAVFDTDEDGYYPGSEATLWDNWRAVRSLFYGSPGRQMTVTRRWQSGYYSASARGVFAGGLEPSNLGLQAFRFTADILLDDPWFYATEQTLGTYAPGTYDITGDIVGDAATPRYTITWAGELTDPTITLKQGTDTLSVLAYSGTISALETLTVTMPDLLWAESGTVTPSDVVPSQPEWLILDPAATSLVIGGTGAGTVTIDYEPAYV